MGRKPKPKTESNKAVSGILDALKFCEHASRDIGQVNQTHMRLANNWATAFDGVIAIGAKIDTDIAACPHTATLVTSLSKCDAATQITQLGDGRLSIKSGRFATFVPCVENDLLAPVYPDQPCGMFPPAVVNALLTVGPIAQENAQRIMLASVILKAGSAIATDGYILAEAWHGTDLPQLLVPKSFITILSKIAKQSKWFGFSPNSLTVYFEDDSWIRTQLYSENPPDTERVTGMQSAPGPIPVGLLDALKKIIDLTGDGDKVYFGPKGVRTELSMDAGASCEIDGGLPDGLCFNGFDLIEACSHSTMVDFMAGPTKDCAVFLGGNYRAFVIQVKAGAQPRQDEPTSPPPPSDGPIPYGHLSSGDSGWRSSMDTTIPF